MSTEVEVPSRQEMFNRAWNGLKSQGFERCMALCGGHEQCAYTDETGTKHCAWGWVDPAAAASGSAGSVYLLQDEKVGIAGAVDKYDYAMVKFMADLQSAHDSGKTPADMEQHLRSFALKYELEIPS